VTVNSTTATTISLSWSVPSGSVVESYEVTWEREGIRSSTTITDGSTSYTITRLEAEANYTITVAASNRAGSAVSDLVTGPQSLWAPQDTFSVKRWRTQITLH